MRNLNLKSMAIAMIAALGLSPTQANATGLSLNDNPYLTKTRQTVKPVRPFRGQAPWGNATDKLNAKLAKKSNAGDRRGVAVAEPSKVFEELSRYDLIEGPDGTTWFYTSDYDIEYEEISEWYTEEYIVGYTFTIYDSSFNEVGKIKDKITLGPGETRVAGAVLDPAISRKFFNNDSKPEVMVYLAMNTGYEYDYKVNYYNKVYSIGGEKDGDGNDVCINTIPGRCVDAFNAGSGENENYFYTFVDDIYPNPDDFSFDQYIDYVNAVKTQVLVYSKGVDSAEPKVILNKDIYMSRYPGDTTDGIYFITKGVDGVPYFIFSQYDKPYFVDPTGFATDESATEDNSLVIEVYSYTDGVNEISTTKIPVEIQNVAGEINYTFYSIGSVGWKDDIDMSVNGTPNAPAFLVARDYTKASNLEEVASSYDIYDNAGNLKFGIAENTDGIALMASIDGEQPQALFVNMDEKGTYTFNFVDLYSGEKVLSLPQVFNGEQLTASCERVADNNGGYKYAFVMQYDEQDTDGNDIKRMAWINKDGSLDRIDKINMGKNVMAASVNMFSECLSPYLYDTDDAMEYAVLVKRSSGNTTKNEFIVVDDDGEWYAHFSDADGKGSPMMFSILPSPEKNYLQMVYYTNNETYNIDIYELPFQKNTSSVENTLVGKADSPIAFDGVSVSAPGTRIEVYSATGVKVAEGNDIVSLDALPRGIYVATASDGRGNQSTLKIAL